MAAVIPELDRARRLVVKIGSALLVDRKSGLRTEWLDSVCADIAALRALVPLGVEGAIVGKALYAGAFTLAEALDVAAAPLISTTLDVDVLASAQPGVRRAAIAAWLTERGAPLASWVHVTAVEALVTDWHGQRGIDVAGGAVLREEGYLVYVPR